MTIKYFRHPELTLEDDIWCNEQADKIFDMSNDPNQMDLEDASFEITKLFPYAWTVIKDDNRIVGYTYILPTTNNLMKKFVSEEITEKQMSQIINTEIRYNNCDAIYLAGAFFIEEYQNKGLAIRSTIDTIRHMDKERGLKIKDLYIWPFTEAMINMIEKAKILVEKDNRILHVYYLNK